MSEEDIQTIINQIKISSRLSDRQQSLVHAVIRKYIQAFLAPNEPTPMTDAVECELWTNSAAPIHQRPYRVSQAERRVIPSGTTKDALIESDSTKSPWSSPVDWRRRKMDRLDSV